jgi:outer membrane protein TolC
MMNTRYYQTVFTSSLFLALSLLFALSPCVSTAGAQDSLSLHDYLDQIKASHPFLNAEQNAIEAEREALTATEGSQDWQLGSSASYEYSEPTADQFVFSYETNTTVLDATASRHLWSSGGTVSVGAFSALDNRDNASLSIPVGNSVMDISLAPSQLHVSGAFAQYTQPLLKNLGGTLSRLPFDLQQYNLNARRIAAEENSEAFLLGSATQYLDWVQLNEQVKIYKRRLALSEQQVIDVKEKLNVNLVDKVDLLRAEDDARLNKQQLERLRSLAEGVQQQIRVKLGWDTSRAPAPTANISAPTPRLGREQASQCVVHQSRKVRVFEQQILQLTKQLEGAEQNELSTLNLVLRSEMRGDDEESFGGSLGLDQPTIFAGLEFQRPLGKTTENAQIREINQRINEARNRQRSAKRNVEQELRDVYAQLDKLDDILVLNKELQQSARLRTKEERKLYTQGRSEINFVLESLDNEQNADLIYLQNAIAQQKLYQRYLELVDELLPSSDYQCSDLAS